MNQMTTITTHAGTATVTDPGIRAALLSDDDIRERVTRGESVPCQADARVVAIEAASGRHPRAIALAPMRGSGGGDCNCSGCRQVNTRYSA